MHYGFRFAYVHKCGGNSGMDGGFGGAGNYLTGSASPGIS